MAVVITLTGVAAPVTQPVSASGAMPANNLSSLPATPLPEPPSANFKQQGTLPKGVRGLKGMPGQSVKQTKTSSPLGLLSGCASPCYYYNVGSQGFTGTLPTGSYGYYSVNANPSIPTLSSGDYHTLAENAVQKDIGGQRNIVEVGWTIDRTGVNGTDYIKPHLFVFWWKNGVAQCYNGCGWVPYPGAAFTVGQLVPSSTTSLKLGIENSGGNWWVWASDSSTGVGGWIGYYPGTLWSQPNSYGPAVSGFTNVDYAQFFGEIASNNAPASTVCTDMGSLIRPTTPSTVSAYISSVAYIGLPTSSVSMYVRPEPTGIDPYWNTQVVNSRTFRYGGPGGC